MIVVCYFLNIWINEKILYSNYTSGKKETVYCKNIDNSKHMQRMNMKIYKYGVPNTNI